MRLRVYWDDYNYDNLHSISTVKRYSRRDGSVTYNNAVIMLDTETSKKSCNDGEANHICAFSVAIRDIKTSHNICALYGNNPLQCIECIKRICSHMRGHYTVIYVHNLGYDYVFLRKFLFDAFGTPRKQLNIKPYYPINIEFDNGLIFKDSLILSQKKLERWATDMNVEHKKAVGNWNYDKIRNQDYIFSSDEIVYITNDVLAGVECIDTLREQLHHRIYAMPYTATGIVREDARKIAKTLNAHDDYIKCMPSYDVYLMMEQCFHGGYTHANRYHISEVITDTEYGVIKCYDFKSSYPYVMLTEKYPKSKFMPYRPRTSIDKIISLSDRYAFMTRLLLIKPRIKDNNVVMPVLQSSKIVKSVNAVIDNGRVLCAGYIEICVTEVTLKLIREQYDYDYDICLDNYYSLKGYLPRWYTDYVYKLFKDKCELDGVDQLNYNLAKAKLNSCYGMSVQKVIQDVIEEHYYNTETIYTTISNYNEEEYKNAINNRNKFLPYQWGVWVTEYALYNLHTFANMTLHGDNSIWLYSDTDSVYGVGFDISAVTAYNDICMDKLHANNYDTVYVDNISYTLGIAELDKECSEFITLGAKRYCYRSAKDNELHITVAGVPKSGSICLNDDINNFRAGMIFDGIRTGKKQHKHIYVDDIYIDDNGNITGDSIDLSPCDYLLDAIHTEDWESIFTHEIEVQTYDV